MDEKEIENGERATKVFLSSCGLRNMTDEENKVLQIFFQKEVVDPFFLGEQNPICNPILPKRLKKVVKSVVAKHGREVGEIILDSLHEILNGIVGDGINTPLDKKFKRSLLESLLEE